VEEQGRESVSWNTNPNIFCVKTPEEADANENVDLPGWYFWDEAGQAHGPFRSLEETKNCLETYAREYL
jgi:hypothetical protein